jgi:hypothetical protein
MQRRLRVRFKMGVVKFHLQTGGAMTIESINYNSALFI